MLADCKKCPLWETRTNIVFGGPNPAARIMTRKLPVKRGSGVVNLRSVSVGAKADALLEEAGLLRMFLALTWSNADRLQIEIPSVNEVEGVLVPSRDQILAPLSRDVSCSPATLQHSLSCMTTDKCGRSVASFTRWRFSVRCPPCIPSTIYRKEGTVSKMTCVFC